ncbi:MAG: hypothetical protein LBN30_07900, partial [Oscillospiraceae bacterium]|nr:hypothetical protein [Oscillospiraceae bacterium]
MRRLLLILLAALVLFQLVACSGAKNANDTSVEGVDYATFRDVPGVTAEEIAAIEELAKRTSFFTYGMTMSTECFRDSEDSTTKGYSVLFCEWLTEFIGIRFRPVIYNW